MRKPLFSPSNRKLGIFSFSLPLSTCKKVCSYCYLQQQRGKRL